MEVKIMKYVVFRMVDGEWYRWGAWTDRNKANEVAQELRDTCEDILVEEHPE